MLQHHCCLFSLKMSVSQLVQWSLSKHCLWGYYNWSANTNSPHSKFWAAEKKSQHRAKSGPDRNCADKPLTLESGFLELVPSLHCDFHLSAPFSIVCLAQQHVCPIPLQPTDDKADCWSITGVPHKLGLLQDTAPYSADRLCSSCASGRGALAVQLCRGISDCIQAQQHQSWRINSCSSPQSCKVPGASCPQTELINTSEEMSEWFRQT